MAEDLIVGFDRAMRRILERAAGLRPPLAFPGFRGMLAQQGGKRTADILLAQPTVSDGFTKLVLHSLETDTTDALRLTVEHLILQQPWRQLFTPEQLVIAERRLREIGCPLPTDSDNTMNPLLAAVPASAARAESKSSAKKRVSDLSPPSQQHSRYAEIIESEGWSPLILCDNVDCYWNSSTAQTRDGRTLDGISIAAQEHLLTLLQKGEYGDEGSNIVFDHRRWEVIRDKLLIWPDPEVIVREGFRVQVLRRKPTGAAIPPEPSLPLGPTTGPRPASWTGIVSRNASGQSHAYVFRFGDHDVWKIGHAMDVHARLAEVNKHVPYEILGEQWQLYLYRLCESQETAYAIEQRLLTLLRTTSSVGERVMCTRDTLDIAWNEVVTRPESHASPRDRR